MYFISRKRCLQLWFKQPAKMNPYLNNKEYNFPYLLLIMVIVSAMSYNTAFISQALQGKYIKLVFPLIKTLSRGSFMVYYKSVRFCHYGNYLGRKWLNKGRKKDWDQQWRQQVSHLCNVNSQYPQISLNNSRMESTRTCRGSL